MFSRIFVQNQIKHFEGPTMHQNMHFAAQKEKYIMLRKPDLQFTSILFN